MKEQRLIKIIKEQTKSSYLGDDCAYLKDLGIVITQDNFVEDVLRDVVLMLRKDEKIDSFEVECESLESIHNHSAWAFQQEG